MFFKKEIIFLSLLFFCINSFLLSAETWCSRLVKDMQRYDQGDKLFHSGNVMQHSIWALRNAASWIKEEKAGKDIIWLEGIDIEKYEKVLMVTAFLHDIGKCGDNKFEDCRFKSNHAKVGFNYLFSSLNEKGSFYQSQDDELNQFDFTKLFAECGLGKNDMKLAAIATKMHYGLGNVMQAEISKNPIEFSEESIKKYLSDLRDAANEVKYPMSEVLVKICILISAADVKGFDPIDYSAGMFEAFGVGICPEWVADIGIAHKSGGDGWKNWRYGTDGVQARAAIIEYYLGRVPNLN